MLSYEEMETENNHLRGLLQKSMAAEKEAIKQIEAWSLLHTQTANKLDKVLAVIAEAMSRIEAGDHQQAIDHVRTVIEGVM